MKKPSKVLALLFAALLTVSAFGGCSEKGGNSSAARPGTGTSEPGTLDTSKEVELVLYVVSDRPAKQDALDANFNAYLKEKLNCTLKTNWIGWAEYANKYPLLFSSGEKFDMAYSATWLNFSSLAQKGAFMNLDELWPAYAPKNFAMQSETAKRQATIDGHYYGIPTLLATYSAYGPTYRTDFLEGSDWNGKMENLADLEVYFGYVKRLTDLEPLDIYQAGSEVDDLFMYEHGLYALKGANFLWIDPAEANPQIFPYYDYDKTPEFLEMMNRWNNAGYFTKSALSDTDSTKLKNGKAAVKIHNIDSYAAEYIDNPDWGFKFANFVSDLSYLSFMQDSLVISNTAENPERALAMYDLITSDETAYRNFIYGIEGVSYKIINNEVEALDTADMPFSSLWAARTSAFNLPTVGSPPDLQTLKDSYDTQIQEGVGAQKYPSFNLNTASIETEFAACQNVHQQYWWPLELGYTDAETGLAEYRQKMEAAGIAKVIKVLQEQLDEYVKTLA